jgi:Protein of unknown function (DUF2723)
VSSLFGALALCAQYALARVAGFGIAAAVAVALILGLSQTYFALATEAEVYALHTFWALTCLALFVHYLNTRARRALLAFFVAYGIALGHHPMMVLLVAPVFVSVLIHDRGLFKDWRGYAYSLLAATIGLTQYFYTYRLFVDDSLVYRFSEYPVRDLRSFVDFTSGGGFKSKMFSQPWATVWRERIPALLKLADTQNTLLFPAVGLLGLVVAREPATASRTLLCLTLLAHLVWALGYDVDDFGAFCTPLWALSYLAVVAGLQALLPHRIKVLPVRPAVALAFAIAVVAFYYRVLATDIYRPDNYRLAIANEFISKVPPGSLILPWKHEGNSALQGLFRYLQASGDSGPIRITRYLKHCNPDAYFTDGGRKLIRVRKYRARRVGRIERAGQDLFVMECDQRRD